MFCFSSQVVITRQLLLAHVQGRALKSYIFVFLFFKLQMCCEEQQITEMLTVSYRCV